MATEGKWKFEEAERENWTTCEKEYDTKEEAIEAGKKFFKEWKEEDPEGYQYDYGLDYFQVGQIYKYVPYINVECLLERISENAYNDCGEWAEDYLYDVKREHQAELEKELNQVFLEWAKRYGYMPRWFNIHNVETVSID